MIQPGTTRADEAAESFFTRLGDQIDDRIALAFDEQLEERLDEARRQRAGGLAAVCASAAAGAAVTIATPHSVTTLLIAWAALVMINAAYFFRRALPSPTCAYVRSLCRHSSRNREHSAGVAGC